MSKEEKFEYDIANLKQDFAIENMTVAEQDIELLRRYSNEEITMNEMITTMKESVLGGNY